MTRRQTDPGACWIRHVKRAGAGVAGAVDVLEATFVAQPLPGVNGRQGWQSAQPEVRLSDDGSLSVRFPNAAGEDGRLHRDRFAITTDPLYRPGEEWLEVYREPDDLLIVATPVRFRLDRSELTLEGLDAPALMRNSLSSESDIWVGAAPLDVLAFYASAPVMTLAQDFAGVDGAELPAGWTSGGTAGAPVQASAGDGIALQDAGAVTPQFLRYDAPAAPGGTDYIAEVRLRHWSNTVASSGRIRVTVGQGAGVAVQVAPQHTGPGNVASSGGGLDAGTLTGVVARLQYEVPTIVVHRVIARGEWLYYFVNGELVFHGRRGRSLPTALVVDVVQGAAVVQAARIITLEPLLIRDAPVDRRLPGVPPPGGLRARYYLESDSRAKVADATVWRHAALSPFLEPYAERLEAPAFAAANPPAWQPPGPPSGEGFSARWTGAIYLDLAAGERSFSVDAGGETYGRIRVWIGGELVVDYSAQEPVGSPGRVFSNALRPFLGELAGWYPICVEYSHLTGAGALGIYDQAGAYNAATRVAVPAERLSPMGVVDREVRNESHREVFGDVASSFGYQWRVEPRALESGHFPGELTVAPRVGRDTALVVDTLGASEVGTEVDASDAVDGLVVDASGLATIKDDAQLSHEAFLPAATDHLLYTVGYESLAEISEEPLLRARSESLLFLRSTPAETVGLRPEGHREVVDAFPLPDTPDFQRMRWLPGDGLRLELPELAVSDATPRQLTVIQWPLRPDGASPPVVSYRQRGRGARAALERLRSTAYASRRNYQGQRAIVVGTVGASPAVANVGDVNSRLNLPRDRKILALELVVQAASAGARTVYVNGVATTLILSRPGLYSLDRHWTPDGLNQRVYVELRDTTASGGAWTYALEATVLI